MKRLSISTIFPKLSICLVCMCTAIPSLTLAQNHTSLIDYVNPFIGTSNFGATHPGAQYPHGMASVAPFNVAFKAGKENPFEKDSSWHSRPYVNDNAFLTGFSHVNLSGVGCPDLGSILLMPTSGDLVLNPQEYGSTYSNEDASPGYYSSVLNKYKIQAELSSTLRSGISRYTFPTGKANIILNLGLGLTNETGSMLRIVSDNEVEGFKMVGTFCYNPEDVRPVYFVAKISKPAEQFGAWKKMPEYTGVEAEWVKYNGSIKPYPSFTLPIAGDDIGAYFSFESKEQQIIDVKVGISYVSIDNARANLESEQPNFAFEQTRKKSEKKWNSLLERIKLEGKEQDKTLFYSALYHILIHPNIIQDVNGDYPLMGSYETGNVKDKNRYSVFSLWDTSRNLHPFLSLVYPELQSQMVNSMTDMAKESGWLPKWELLGMETQVMVGDPGTVVIADTYLRGIQDFDIEAAYKAARKSALQIQNNLLRPDIEDYLKLGYVPVDDEGTWDGTVSTSLEYYIADWNLAQLAKMLGKTKDAQLFGARSMNYKILFDSETGMLRPKYANGDWFAPYDPQLGRNFEPAPGYVEGNAWNYRFYVPHDIPGLISSLGGEKQFLKQLQLTFDSDNYDMANEPDITYPFLFNYIKGEEWRTSAKVSELITKYYTNSPSGIPGNDDAGTLSTWLLYAMIGLYPMSPGNMDYALFSPRFDRIEILLDPKYYSGESLIIERSSDSSSFNGAPLKHFFINHHLLVEGGTLISNMP